MFGQRNGKAYIVVNCQVWDIAVAIPDLWFHVGHRGNEPTTAETTHCGLLFLQLA
jgi:predicted heme/steroid binding protein